MTAKPMTAKRSKTADAAASKTTGMSPKAAVNPASKPAGGAKSAKPAAKAAIAATAHKAATAGKPKSATKSAAVAAAPAKVEAPAGVAPATARAPAAAPTGKPAAQRAMPAASASAGMRTSAPMSPKDIANKVSAQRQAAAVAAQAQAAAAQLARKPISQRHGFKINEHVVYPAHGVGRIVGIEEQEIAGMALELFVITFDKDKMTLRVPTSKLQTGGMRKLAEEPVVKRAMETLKGRARVKRTMWSRRAQEYEAKINSGDLVAVAEVVRDLYRSEAQPEQSYSERQLYELALDRMAREIAAVEKLDDRGAVQRIVDELARSAKGRRVAAEEAAAAEVAAGDDEDGDVQAA